MSVKQDIELHEGEDWKISFAAHYADGTNMPLGSGSDVQFRVTDEDGVDKLTFTIDDDGVSITDETNGLAEIKVLAADQYSHSITSSGSYFYAIRVLKGTDVYEQAEGRLKVSHSLFASELDPLIMQFRLRFPEFTEDDGIISIYLKDAGRFVDKDSFWSDDDRPIAKVYLAAHYIYMRLNAKISYENAGVGSGEVRLIRVEDRSVAFNPSKGVQAGKTGLSQSFYGQQYLSLLRQYPQWILRA